MRLGWYFCPLCGFMRVSMMNGAVKMNSKKNTAYLQQSMKQPQLAMGMLNIIKQNNYESKGN